VATTPKVTTSAVTAPKTVEDFSDQRLSALQKAEANQVEPLLKNAVTQDVKEDMLTFYDKYINANSETASDLLVNKATKLFGLLAAPNLLDTYLLDSLQQQAVKENERGSFLYDSYKEEIEFIASAVKQAVSKADSKREEFLRNLTAVIVTSVDKFLGTTIANQLWDTFEGLIKGKQITAPRYLSNPSDKDLKDWSLEAKQDFLQRAVSHRLDSLKDLHTSLFKSKGNKGRELRMTIFETEPYEPKIAAYLFNDDLLEQAKLKDPNDRKAFLHKAYKEELSDENISKEMAVLLLKSASEVLGEEEFNKLVPSKPAKGSGDISIKSSKKKSAGEVKKKKIKSSRSSEDEK